VLLNVQIKKLNRKRTYTNWFVNIFNRCH